MVIVALSAADNSSGKITVHDLLVNLHIRSFLKNKETNQFRDRSFYSLSVIILSKQEEETQFQNDTVKNYFNQIYNLNAFSKT